MCGFYDEMIAFIRSLFESSPKTNSSLEFAVITGCLRISKESIFTGMNNLKIISILSKQYDEYFGFTDEEVQKMCDDYRMPHKFDTFKEWYNGYLFGDANVYNPWSVIQLMDDFVEDENQYPKAYWANTSSNSIVRKLIDMADEDTKMEIEELIAGKTVEKPIHEDITYDEVYKTMDNLWNFMYFTGYIVKSNREGGTGRSDLFIKPVTRRKPAYVLEFKVADKFNRLDATANKALKQIEDRGYPRELEDDGYATVYRYGIAFCGKDCLVKLAETI